MSFLPCPLCPAGHFAPVCATAVGTAGCQRADRSVEKCVRSVKTGGPDDTGASMEALCSPHRCPLRSPAARARVVKIREIPAQIGVRSGGAVVIRFGPTSDSPPVPAGATCATAPPPFVHGASAGPCVVVDACVSAGASQGGSAGRPARSLHVTPLRDASIAPRWMGRGRARGPPRAARTPAAAATTRWRFCRRRRRRRSEDTEI